jgi:hypothetical protein
MSMRVTSIILIGATVLLSICLFTFLHYQSTNPSPPAAIAQRLNLLGGDKCEWVVRSSAMGEGSRGLSLECAAHADQQLVLQVDAKVRAGQWTLRVDDGEQEPIWLPLGAFPALRVTGSKHYRFMIYSDDIRSEISITDLTIRTAVDADAGLPLAWSTGGAVTEKDQQGTSSDWKAALGILDDRGVVESAKRITSFVYQRSNVVRASQMLSVGAPRDWMTTPPRQINGSCGNFSVAMCRFCKTVGITARIVNLASGRFANGSAPFDTHVLVEVFDPESRTWFLADPTFNLTFEGPSGHLLGLKELLEAAAGGKNWRPVPVGPLRPGRTIDDYYLPYADLLHVGYAPPVPTLGDLGVEFRTHELTIDEMGRVLYPATW